MLLYDTNILLYLVRDEQDKVRNLVNPDNDFEAICEVSIGEMFSLAYQLGWGKTRIEKMNDLLSQINVFHINEDTVKQTYAEIDAYSKNKHPKKTKNGSAIKMGKNDIWIASIASLAQIKLITTDKDFDHLDTTFLKLQKIDPKLFVFP
jgi:predicted nucleic acid-binding protein